MNYNPQAIRVLCYGDSNTYGMLPDGSRLRYPLGVRWTGRLQQALGADYEIIEEGLSSRATDLEFAKRPGRNGRELLAPLIASHNPLDIVVLMLGTCDLKIEYHRSAQQITHAIKLLIEDIIKNTVEYNGRAAKIILVSPVPIRMHDQDESAKLRGLYDLHSEDVSKELADEYGRLANELGIEFIDTSELAQYIGEDGAHWQPKAHELFSKKIAEVIRAIR